MGLRDETPPVSVACNPETQEEQENLALSLQKMRELARVPVIESLALMPDNCPSGQEWGAIPVGGAITTKNEIIPAAHSADAWCSMHATFFEAASPVAKLMGELEKSTHFGPYPAPAGKENPHPVLSEPVWENPFLAGLEETALKYLGTQGDGNHFAYIGEIEISRTLLDNLDANGQYELAKTLWPAEGKTLKALVTHHGSRNFGAKIYKRGLEAAMRETAKIAEGIPKTGAWLDLSTEAGRNYWAALDYARRWTLANHEVIHKKFLAEAGAQKCAGFGNAHNAVWRHDGLVYHGKGATPAWPGPDGRPQLGIIPLNMSREILLVAGKNNPEFLSFCPHGAGRNRSRTATIHPFLNPETGKIDQKKMEVALAEETRGLEIRWGSKTPDISESPLGYKPASKIKAELQEFGLATLLGEISPKGCIMAGHIEPIWKKKKNPKNPEIAI